MQHFHTITIIILIQLIQCVNVSELIAHKGKEMNKKKLLILGLLLSLYSFSGASDIKFYSGATYNSEIPTLKQIVGHNWGEMITAPDEMERYLKALAEVSSKVQIIEYGKTWENRPLFYLIVTSDENMARVEEIKSNMRKLADPGKSNKAEAEAFIKSQPAITWLAYGVHGNEISSPEAAMLTAYHLVAVQNDSLADLVLNNSVVIIDPLQNPDGRNRFVHYYEQTRGRWPDPDQQAAEHNEDWPGGRSNHYQFDMNRDWFARTQIETRGRIIAYLEWFPQVFVDFHEMGSNSTYYFAPPAFPHNPEMPPAQINWLKRFGQNNARWFDRMQFDYFTQEVFDSFYPGYGEGWPMFQGSVGMTYEQASTRGLVVKRDDKTTMYYHDAVQHHFIASLATAETTARNREAMLRYFYNYRQSAIQEGSRETVKEFIISPGNDPNRAAKLASNLIIQGIEVKQAKTAFSNSKVRDYYESKLESKKFPAGSYIVTMAQPSKHLVKTLLAKHTPMDDAFINEQLRRYDKRLRNQFYDLTGWSLPLLYDVECYMAETVSRGQFDLLQTPIQIKGRIQGDKAHLAYLIPWGTNSAVKALAQIQQDDLQVYSADKSFKLNGTNFPAGSLIIKVKNNPDDLHNRLEIIAASTGVDIYSTNTAWVEKGINFGSNQVRFLKKPRIAIAYQTPTNSSSFGWTRYLLEQEYSYPVTLINTMQLSRVDLSKYNVLILPNSSSRFGGGYNQIFGESGARKIKEWVQAGGTLITIGQATQWLTGEKVGLLATSRENRGGKSEKSGKEKPQPDKANQQTKSAKASSQPVDKTAKPFDVEQAIQPEKELPGATPGAIMRIKLDTEHWLAFGYDQDANVIVSSRNIYTPIKLDKGRNIGLYMPEDKVLLSGFTFADSHKQIASKAYLMYQPHGRGHVVAFAEDPNYRAFLDGINLLFMNAIFLGPGH